MVDNFADICSDISIVLQGPIRVDNIVQIANHCRHWRQLFPKAEIILSISTNEALEGKPGHERSAGSRYRLHHRHTPNTFAENATKIIDECCDTVVIAAPGLPLPPIKPTDGSNNSDFMINAAKAGLDACSKKYVLRIRSDVIFLNKNFLNLYLETAILPRRFRCILTQRVMICNLFTVSPFGVERMPYHYSDWFNFGLLQDVKNIWDVPTMSYADTVYYKVNPHAENSNFRETNFNTRIGVEQHVYTSFLRKNEFECGLEYHNDMRTVTESLMILENEFIIADADYLKLMTQDRSDYLKFDWVDYICIHHHQWRKLLTTNPSDYKSIFADKIEIVARVIREHDEPASSLIDKQNVGVIHAQEDNESFDTSDDEPQPISNGIKTDIGTNYQKKRTYGLIILPLYKMIITRKMRLKLQRDPHTYFEDSKNPIAKMIYKISYFGK